MTRLRCILPDGGEKAPNRTKLLREILQIVVFGSDATIFLAVAGVLADLTRLRGN
jgi:hypothetical protein